MNNETKQEVHVNVYGKNAPKAATFGKGAVTPQDIAAALKARRDQRPGDAER